MQDKTRFSMVMTMLSESTRQPLSKVTLDMWWRMFESISDDAFEQACMRHLQASKWMPAPSDIFEQLDGKLSEKAMYAWNLVYEAIKRVGSWESVLFEDYVIHMVLADMGGWIRLCESTTDELVFVAKEFQKRYEEKINSLKSGRVKTSLPMLRGRADIENASQGLEMTSMTMIGDVGKCKKLLLENEKRKSGDFLVNCVNEVNTQKLRLEKK